MCSAFQPWIGPGAITTESGGWLEGANLKALRIYFVNFLQRTDWHRPPGSTVVDEHGRVGPLAALEDA